MLPLLVALFLVASGQLPTPPRIQDRFMATFVVNLYSADPDGSLFDFTSVGKVWYDYTAQSLRLDYIDGQGPNPAGSIMTRFLLQNKNSQLTCNMYNWDVYSRNPLNPPDCSPVTCKFYYNRLPSPTFLADAGAKFAGFDTIGGQEATLWTGNGPVQPGWPTSGNTSWTYWVSISEPPKLLKLVAQRPETAPGSITFVQNFYYSDKQWFPDSNQLFYSLCG